MKIKLRKDIGLCIGLAATLAWGCSDQDGVAEQPTAESRPCSISISVDGNQLITSRTSVVDPDDNLRGKQHVTRVQLYIYKADGQDYTCVATEDVKWNHLAGAMAGLETKQQYYTTKYQDYEEGVNYLFMAVGFDDTYSGTESEPIYANINSVKTYGEPDKVATIDKKLSEERFALQEGCVPADIASSELFAGSNVYTVEQLRSFEASNEPIELYRRVAGVAGYFKNLQKTYGGKEVDKVSLCLYTEQNTKTEFLPKYPDAYSSAQEVPDAEYIDYITSPWSGDGGEVIASINASEVQNGEFTFSSYVLPIAASVAKGESTLAIVFYGSDGSEIAKRRVLYSSAETGMSRSGTGIIDVDGDDDGTDSKYMHYPLRANHFYRIGSKDEAIDLSGQTGYIYLELDPVWNEYYGGTLDNEEIIPGVGIDKEWGDHEGGKLDPESATNH